MHLACRMNIDGNGRKLKTIALKDSLDLSFSKSHCGTSALPSIEVSVCNQICYQKLSNCGLAGFLPLMRFTAATRKVRPARQLSYEIK